MNSKEFKSNKPASKRDDQLVLDSDKRTQLKWVAPIVMGVVLPVHAQATTTTTTLEPVCTASPVMETTVPSKCATVAGSDEIAGQATVTLSSDSEPIEIVSISHNGGSEIQLPGLPATVTSGAGVNIVWTGPGSDGTTCLPITQITFTVTYTCNGASSQMATFNLTELLAAAIP